MLAEFYKTALAVVLDLQSGMLANGRDAFIEGRGTIYRARTEIVLDLFEKPRIPKTAASNENAVCAGDVHRFTGKFRGCDIAIYKKGEMGDVFTGFTDAMPVGFAGIALLARAAVHRD